MNVGVLCIPNILCTGTSNSLIMIMTKKLQELGDSNMALELDKAFFPAKKVGN